MAPPLLTLDGILLTFGGTPLLDGADLSASAGDRIALVGRNGSGKSTLLKIAAGMVEPQDGEVFRQPSATIRYLPQVPDMDGFATVRAYVEAGLGPADDPHRSTYLLDHLGLTGEEKPDELSGGEARRAALARVMAPEPDILLLDEPTNHLDLAVDRMAGRRTATARPRRSWSSRTTAAFSNASRRATVWLDRGKTRRLDKGFAHFEEWRDTVLEEEEREQHKLGRQIVREEHWLRYGVTARRKRNMRRLGESADDARAAFAATRARRAWRQMTASDAPRVRQAGDRGQDDLQELWRPDRREGLLDPHPARRPHRPGRPERRRQDDAAQDADRRTGARHRHACGSASISRSRRSTRSARPSIPTKRWRIT